jgi:hypothetical protein
MQTIDLVGANAGRQDVIVASVPVVFGSAVANSDFAGVTGTKTAIAVPAGAIVVGGFYRQVSGTTASVDVGIGDGGSADRYKADIDAAAAGTTALVPTGYQYTSDDTIDILVDAALPAAGGSGLLVVEYIVAGRSAFVQK